MATFAVIERLTDEQRQRVLAAEWWKVVELYDRGHVLLNERRECPLSCALGTGRTRHALVLTGALLGLPGPATINTDVDPESGRVWEDVAAFVRAADAGKPGEDKTAWVRDVFAGKV